MQESIIFLLVVFILFAVLWIYMADMKAYPGLLPAGFSLPSLQELKELKAPNVGKNFRESNVLRSIEDLPLR
ncbi:MAG: hypothetical protein HYV78_01660 [Candidatus Wildermuthbacteria bacterium]|nr:hypothetical protein [Candidatus Wildermuthbacteria bacterium]